MIPLKSRRAHFTYTDVKQQCESVCEGSGLKAQEMWFSRCWVSTCWWKSGGCTGHPRWRVFHRGESSSDRHHSQRDGSLFMETMKQHHRPTVQLGIPCRKQQHSAEFIYFFSACTVIAVAQICTHRSNWFNDSIEFVFVSDCLQWTCFNSIHLQQKVSWQQWQAWRWMSSSVQFNVSLSWERMPL